jgi:hypothetical protein
MGNRFTDAIKAHKNVVIAAIAVTGLMGYILPGSLPAAQADWSPGWWTTFTSAFTSAFSSAESEAEGGDAEAESGDATAAQLIEGNEFDQEIEQESTTTQTNALSDDDNVAVTQTNAPTQTQVGLYGNVNTQEIGDLTNAANIETPRSMQQRQTKMQKIT